MRFPIRMAKFLGDTTAKYRWFAIAYMVMMFLVLPLVVMGLSFAGSIYVIVFASIAFILMMFVLVVNLLREKKPEWVPQTLKTWKWLPKPLRSLEPYDNVFSRLACCRKLKNKSQDGPNMANGSTTDHSMTVISSKEPSSEGLHGYTNTAFEK